MKTHSPFPCCGLWPPHPKADDADHSLLQHQGHCICGPSAPLTCLALGLLCSLSSNVTSPERFSLTSRSTVTNGGQFQNQKDNTHAVLCPHRLFYGQLTPCSPGSVSPAPGGSHRHDPAGILPSPRRWYSSGCSQKAAPMPGRRDHR